MSSPRRSPRIQAASPRRSPRLYAGQQHDDHGKRHDVDAGSPLSSRARPTVQAARRSLSPSKPSSAGHASGGSSSSNGAASAAKKLSRRAYSVGGLHHSHLSQIAQDSENQPLALSNRRDAVSCKGPCPRKSSIRTGPPQVFASPTDTSPPPSIRPLAARLSTGIEALGGPDLMNLMESIGLVQSPKGKGKAIEETPRSHTGALKNRKTEPTQKSATRRTSSALLATDDDTTIARKRRRVTFNPFQENADFEKDEPTIHIRHTGEAVPLPETSVSTNDSSDMSLASSISSSSHVSSGDESASHDDTSDPDDDEEEEEEEEEDGSRSRQQNEDREEENNEEGEVEEQVAPAPEGDHDPSQMDGAGSSALGAEDDSAMDMTVAYGGARDGTIASWTGGLDESAPNMDLQSEASMSDAAANTTNHDDQTVTMQLTAAFGSRPGWTTDEEDEDSVALELTSERGEDSPIPADDSDAMDMTRASGGIVNIEEDNGAGAIYSSPKRGRMSPRKSMLSHAVTKHATSPRRSPRKSIGYSENVFTSNVRMSRTADVDSVESDQKQQIEAKEQESDTKHDNSSVSPSAPETDQLTSIGKQSESQQSMLRASMGDVSPRKVRRAINDPAKMPDDRFSASTQDASVSVLRNSMSRLSTHKRAHAQRQEESVQSGDKSNQSPRTRPRTPDSRRPLHETHQNSSPRLGHEYCKMPAAESPKPRVSAATLKAQARRAEKTAAATGAIDTRHSPVKSASTLSRASIGHAPPSPEKTPFRPSSPRKQAFSEHPDFRNSPSRSRVSQNLLASPSRKPRQSLAVPAVQPKTHLESRKSMPAPPTRALEPKSPQRRPSSPLRHPSTPSRTWRSFRESSSPSTPKSPARRIPLEVAQPMSSGTQGTVFGSPQRVVVQPTAEKSRDGVGRSLTTKTTAGSRPVRPDTSAVLTPVPGGEACASEERWTMKRFFDMLNMGFLDLSMPSKRRIDLPQDTSTRPATTSICRAACATVPAVDSLVDACRELKASVSDGRQMLSEHERDFFDNPPTYVAEVVAMTTSAERQKAMSSFKLQKSAARAIAQKAYYGWRTDKQYDDVALQQLITIRQTLEADISGARKEHTKLRGDILPVLSERYAALSSELAQARIRQHEINGWDNEEMRAMHAAMEEQSAVLEEQRAAQAESADQLARLQARLDDLAHKRKGAEVAIAEAQASSHAIRGSTRAEAARLARHIGQLESLHLWSLHKADTRRIHLVLEGQANLILYLAGSEQVHDLPGASRSPARVKSARIHLLQPAHSSAAAALAVNELQSVLDSVSLDARPVEIVRLVSTAWTRARQIDVVVAGLELHMPVTVSNVVLEPQGLSNGGTVGDMALKQRALAVSASILFAHQRAKVAMHATVSAEALLDARQPVFGAANVSVECVYGGRRGRALAETLASRIASELDADESVRTGEQNLAGVALHAIAMLRAQNVGV